MGGLSLNPWGGAPAPAPGAQGGGSGLDLAGRLGGLASEQNQRAQQEAEMMRRRQDEEVQRRAMAQRQAEEQARQQQAQAAAMQQQQAPQQQSQVELVLMERICSILENSWGRSDLASILQTLHSEDSRVLPLLGNVDALRALIARSPQRVALRRDPSFNGDMAVLLMTNVQWQQQRQQQQQAQARQQQEELHRRRMEEEAMAQRQRSSSIQIHPDLPWFYSDPQKNIQVGVGFVAFLQANGFACSLFFLFHRVHSEAKKCDNGLKQVISKVIFRSVSNPMGPSYPCRPCFRI